MEISLGHDECGYVLPKIDALGNVRLGQMFLGMNSPKNGRTERWAPGSLTSVLSKSVVRVQLERQLFFINFVIKIFGLKDD